MLDLKGMLMLFIRCEMAARVYANINDLTRDDFTSNNTSKDKETTISLQTLFKELREIYNLLTFYSVSPLSIYWMLA